MRGGRISAISATLAAVLPATVGWTAAAVLGSLLSQWLLPSRLSELWSETVCWLLLLAVGSFPDGTGLKKRNEADARDSDNDADDDSEYDSSLDYLSSDEEHRSVRPVALLGLGLGPDRHLEPRRRHQSRRFRARPLNKMALWTVVLGLAAVAVYKTEFGAGGFLPCTTPLLLLVEQQRTPNKGGKQSSSSPSPSSSETAAAPLAHSLWGTTLVALAAAGALMDWGLSAHLPSLLPVAALLLVYTALSRLWPRGSPLDDAYEDTAGADKDADKEAERARDQRMATLLVSLASRMTVVLTVTLALEAVIFGVSHVAVASPVIAAVGMAKAVTWYSLLQALRRPSASPRRLYVHSRHSGSPPPPSWRLATAVTTFSLVATSDPSMHMTHRQALAYLVASLLAAAQIVHFVPLSSLLSPSPLLSSSPLSSPSTRHTPGRRRGPSLLWLFALVPLVPYLANQAHLYTASHVDVSAHPVKLLMRRAEADLAAMLDRQSKNYTAACDTYRQRYHMEPPPGFEAWFRFAQANKSPIIDEFDTLYASLAPLWTLSGREIQAVMRRVYDDDPDSDLWFCTISLSRASEERVSCRHPYRSYDRHLKTFLVAMLEEMPQLTLPGGDLHFLVNHLDEPRVLAPPVAQADAKAEAARDRSSAPPKKKRPVWDTVTKFCPRQPDGQSGTGDAEGISTLGLPFVTDVHAATDLCRHPEYQDMHGLVMSPTSFRLIEGLIPVLTTGTLSTMGDILYPSAAYGESNFKYDGTKDVSWSDKQRRLYWAGSTTGGYAKEEEDDVGDDGPTGESELWRHFQRHRFVSLAQKLDGRDYVYLRGQGPDGGPEEGRAKAVSSSFLNGRLYDVMFTHIFQCSTAACRAQRAFFRTATWAPKDAALQARLVFDLDGNGISGRYYKMLASRSCPLKQTLLREWHDDRLVPWVHYIPVSASLDELPELVAFLAGTDAGDLAARRVAQQGHDWSLQALRPVDKAIYMYRLMLELARLQDPERAAWPMVKAAEHAVHGSSTE